VTVSYLTTRPSPGRSYTTSADAADPPGFWPVELQHVVHIKADQYDEGSPLLARNWVPLLVNGSSDLLVAAWSDTSEPLVVAIEPEFAPPKVEFQSVEQMATVFNECFTRSAYYLNAEHQLDVDDELYDEIYVAIVGPRPVREI
jgi:hypothetical protein